MLDASALIFVAVIFVAVYVVIRVAPELRREPSDPSSFNGMALYHEQLRGRLPIDIFRELEIVVLPAALEFGWRSTSVDSRRAKYQVAIEGLWEVLPPDCIAEVRSRRVRGPQILAHSLYGRGLLSGVWKFHIRGVRTGIFIRTTAGKRYWLATRHPDELIAAIEAARDGERDPPAPFS